MASTSITITDITQGPFNLWKVMTGVQTAGVTVQQTNPSLGPNCQRRDVQADYGNGGTYIITGTDGGISATNGRRMAPGDVDQTSVSSNEDVSLSQYWFNASANGGRLNVSAE